LELADISQTGEQADFRKQENKYTFLFFGGELANISHEGELSDISQRGDMAERRTISHFCN
jgi:hypothetical protein